MASLLEFAAMPEDAYLWLKWLHILSSTVLFGTGLGTAFQMWSAHRRGDAATIALVAANVVRADWLFTLPAGIVQPLSGLALVVLTGVDPLASWLLAAYVLYLVAFAAWVPVVVLQMRARDLAAAAARAGAALPAEYFSIMRLWFVLGWPGFGALLAIYWLMVARPDLW
jgi:uncharacterized membrane protein